jgi:hypothetical protein
MMHKNKQMDQKSARMDKKSGKKGGRGAANAKGGRGAANAKSSLRAGTTCRALRAHDAGARVGERADGAVVAEGGAVHVRVLARDARVALGRSGRVGEIAGRRVRAETLTCTAGKKRRKKKNARKQRVKSIATMNVRSCVSAKNEGWPSGSQKHAQQVTQTRATLTVDSKATNLWHLDRSPARRASRRCCQLGRYGASTCPGRSGDNRCCRSYS